MILLQEILMDQRLIYNFYGSPVNFMKQECAGGPEQLNAHQKRLITHEAFAKTLESNEMCCNLQ